MKGSLVRADVDSLMGRIFAEAPKPDILEPFLQQTDVYVRQRPRRKANFLDQRTHKHRRA